MKTNCCNKSVGLSQLRLLALACIAVMLPAVASGQEGQPQDTWETYRIIIERNMFSRQRGPRPEPRPVERRPTPQRSAESYYLLRGIVQEDGVYIAFIEDTRRSSVLRLRAGDAVASGSITSLSLDSIEYQAGENTVTILIGQDLEGGLGTVTRAEMSEWSGNFGTTTGSGSSPPPTAEDANVLEMLRARRQQQLGR